MKSGNWDGLLPTGKTRQSTLSVSLNDIGESRYPAHSGPLSTLTRLPYRYCNVVGVDYGKYLLQGNEAVYMAFIYWIAAMARQKGRQKSQQTYITYWKCLSEYHALHKPPQKDGNVLQQMRRVGHAFHPCSID